MRINSPAQIELARRVLAAYGDSWQAVRAAGVRRPDGIIEIAFPRTPERPDQTTPGPAKSVSGGMPSAR